MKWPVEANVITADDSHWDWNSGPALPLGPGMLDGTLHIIFDADPTTLHNWLSRSAPWGAEWMDGSVPEVIADNSRLPSDSDSPGIKFAARERGGPRTAGLEYHDGELLVLDPETGRVWLASCDM